MDPKSTTPQPPPEDDWGIVIDVQPCLYTRLLTEAEWEWLRQPLELDEIK